MTTLNHRPQVCFLLALWGKSYIRMFCEVSLRSLLARGNIPAVALEYHCTFTLLTDPDDIDFFEAQPLTRQLKQYCDLRYVDIRDAIFPNNHSATLTVALERGVRSFGPDMLNTYFVFLVADYLFAGNSFSGLLPYMRKGVSAITAGNFQVVEEEVRRSVRDFIDPATGVIDVPHRKLVAWSLKHLHPMTVANTVSQDDMHCLHSNRLFWRVDDNTLIGRFYLRHMLCVKPETSDYIVGASCDYSFIAEMCPSGNVAHLQDSDAYFVVELQPLLHEGIYVQVGRHAPAALAESLEEWTTAEQRANARYGIVYHAAELPSCTEEVMQKSKAFVERIGMMMQKPPSPVRGHFYWRSCIQWITANLACEPNAPIEQVDSLCHNIWKSPVFGPPLAECGLTLDTFPPMRDADLTPDTRLLLRFFRCYIAWLGLLPDARPWHPHYLDYRLLSYALRENRHSKTLLILKPKRRQWIEWSLNTDFILRTPLIVLRDAGNLRSELEGVTSCVIHLPAEYDAFCGAIFDRLMEVLPSGSLLHIFIKAETFSNQSYTPAHCALRYTHFSQKPGVKLLSRQVYVGRVRRHMDKLLSFAAARLINHRRQPLTVLWNGMLVALLHLAYLLHNTLALASPRVKTPHDGKSICSALLTFRVD